MTKKAMFAVLLTGHGGFDRLQWREDVPVPEPRRGEVFVRIGAAGVNNTDINTRAAWYSRAVTAGTTASAAAAGFDCASAVDSGWTGTPHVVFGPEDFLSRLGALVPSPRVNLTRFHGVFAPHHRLRARIAPGRSEREEAGTGQGNIAVIGAGLGAAAQASLFG